MQFRRLTLTDLKAGAFDTLTKKTKQQSLGVLSVSETGLGLSEPLTASEQQQLSIYAPKIEVLRLDNFPGQVYTRTAARDWALCLVMFPNDEVALVVEYLHGADKVIVTVPAGTPGEDETMIDCAQREAEEELGVQVERIIPLSKSLYLSPRRTAECCHQFLAFAKCTGSEVVTAARSTDDFEEIEVVLTSLTDLFQWVSDEEYEGLESLRSIVLAAMVKLGRIS